MSQLTRREEGAAALELLLTDTSLTPNKPTQAPVAATIATAMLPPPPSTSNSACRCNQDYLQNQDTPSLLELSQTELTKEQNVYIGEKRRRRSDTRGALKIWGDSECSD